MLRKVSLKIGIGAVLLAVLDQFTKWLAKLFLQEPYVLTPWFQLRYEQNDGIAWGINIPYPLLMLLNFTILLLIPWFAWKNLDLRHKLSQITLTLIVGGALGNLYDRLTYGSVSDFISIGSWPVFNLADAFLSIGIFLALLFYGKIKRN